MRILKRVQIEVDNGFVVHSDEPEFKDCTLIVTNYSGESEMLIRKFLDLFTDTDTGYAIIGQDTQGNYYYEQS